MLASRYELVERLGEGGMASVWRARDLKLQLEVALKLMLPGVGSDPKNLERLYREVKLARRVSHPNVARIHDLGDWEGQEFISMELIEGETLERRIEEQGAFAHEEGLALLRQLCAGLAAAHEAGVIHRDLKPANVMLDDALKPGGRAVILDFGIAGWVSELRQTVEQSRGLLVGTPRYMSPEQLEERPVDHRTDIYSLGVVAFELFCGSPPFDAGSFAALALKQIDEPAPDPRSLAPELPIWLTAVIRRCLEKSPGDRFETAAEIGAKLERGT